MERNDFLFPVEERPISFGNDKVIMTTADWIPTSDYKAIIRTDTGKLISIVRDSYTLVTNEEVLNNTLGIIHALGAEYYIDPMLSYVSDERMICHIIFKNIKIQDKESPIHLSMFIQNSYDMSQKFRFRFGSYRLLCSNGALIGYTSNADVFKKHTTHFVIEELQEIVKKGLEQFPLLQARIDELQNSQINLLKFKPIAEKIMGAKFAKHMKDTKGWRNIYTFYDLYNEMTWYTSHKVTPIMREYYFEKISKAFKI